MRISKIIIIIKTIMEKPLIIIQTNSLNQFFKEMYGDKSGELVFGTRGLKG